MPSSGDDEVATAVVGITGAGGLRNSGGPAGMGLPVWRGRAGRLGKQRRRPPVPATEKQRNGRHEERADEECVQEDGKRDRESELPRLVRVACNGKNRKGSSENETGGRNRSTGVSHGSNEGIAQGSTMGLLAHTGHEQDIVILAKSHRENKEQDRYDKVDAAVVRELDEDERGKAECREVGEPYGGDQVQRRDQASQ